MKWGGQERLTGFLNLKKEPISEEGWGIDARRKEIMVGMD